MENDKSLGLLRLSLLFVMTPFVANGQTLNEVESVSLGLQQSNFIEIQASRRDLAHADLVSAETWLNPEISISHEKSAGDTEINIWLQQTFDFSKQRQYSKETALVYLEAVESDNAFAQLELTTQIRRHFYRVLYLQEKTKLFNHWIEKFTDVDEAMKIREAAGDISGYDRMRMSRERMHLETQLRQIEAELAEAKALLIGTVDPSRQLQVNAFVGRLVPENHPSLEEVISVQAKHPELLSLKSASEAATISVRAAKRSHYPEVTLAIGQKILDDQQGRDAEFMFSASLPLPLFDRKQGEKQRAFAFAKKVENQYQRSLQENHTATRALWIKAKQLRESAVDYKKQSIATSYTLVQIAENAYHAGETSVVELIDSYRSTMGADLTALGLDYEARQARIELDSLSGHAIQALGR